VRCVKFQCDDVSHTELVFHPDSDYIEYEFYYSLPFDCSTIGSSFQLYQAFSVPCLNLSVTFALPLRNL
jgi:hypothetical protein